MSERVHHYPPRPVVHEQRDEDSNRSDSRTDRTRPRESNRSGEAHTQENPATVLSKNYAAGSGQRSEGGTTLAGGGGLRQVPQNSENQAYLQNLINHGYSEAQIRQMYESHTGQTLSAEELAYAREGFGAFDGPYPTQFKGYGNSTNPLIGRYGSPEFTKYLQDQQMVQDARDTARTARSRGEQERVKIHMILLQILMGDIVGALRSYAILMDRDMRQFTRLLVNKLDKVRQARSQVIRNFGTTKPPRAYAGKDPGTAARAQDRSAKYTQFVQMSTQLMNELQNTEREMVDALQTQFRNVENFWQSYSSIRDEKFRTDEKVVTFR